MFIARTGYSTCIDSCELLKEHRDGSDDHPLKHPSGSEERANRHELELESVPGSELDKTRPLLRSGALLEYRLCFDLQELQFDEFVIFRQVSQTGQHMAGLGFAAVVD